MERDPSRTRKSATRSHAGAGPRRNSRRVRRNRLLALAILAVLALAALAPTGQADSQARAERQAQRAVVKAQQQAEREAKRAQREARRSEYQQKLAQRHAKQQATAEQRELRNAADKLSEHADVKITCTSITVEFQKFTPVAGSPQTIFQKVVYKELPRPRLTYVFAPPPFEVNGSGATEVIPIAAPLGESTVSIRGHFSGNDEHGNFNISEKMTCPPNPQFTLETLQSLGGQFGAGPLAGSVGETIDYETVATNTGNTPLVFAAPSEPGCDGTPAGGTATAVKPRGSVTWFCHHTLTAADATAGLFANATSVSATPEPDPAGDPILLTSNGVLVSPVTGISPSEVTSTSTTSTTTTPAPTNGSQGNGAPAQQGTPKGGTLSFSSKPPVPSLLGPARCIRGAFTVAVKSAGVSAVTFYLEGRKLARRTAHSSVRGEIAIRIDGGKMRPGLHQVLAKISMADAVSALRTRFVRRCRPAASAERG